LAKEKPQMAANKSSLPRLKFQVVTMTPERNKLIQEALFSIGVRWTGIPVQEAAKIRENVEVIGVNGNDMYHYEVDKTTHTNTIPLQDAVEIVKEFQKIKLPYVEFEIVDGAFRGKDRVYQWQDYVDAELKENLIFGGWIWENKGEEIISQMRYGIDSCGDFTDFDAEWAMALIPRRIRFWKKS
jgi:hypothetical protein